MILFNEKALDSYDFWDSHKMFTGIVPEIYTLAGTEKLAINGLKSAQTSYVIPLGFRTLKENTFTLSLEDFNNFGLGAYIALVDNNTIPAKVTNLTLSSYTFTSTAVEDANRFSLILKDQGTITKASINEITNCVIFPLANRRIAVICNEHIEKNGMIAVYNNLGQQILVKTLTENISVIDALPLSGVYLVNVINGANVKTEKIIIN